MKEGEVKRMEWTEIGDEGGEGKGYEWTEMEKGDEGGGRWMRVERRGR